MSMQCSNCAHWSGKDTDYMSDCSQMKQRTTFDFSCPLFSQRAKPKNHNGERGELAQTAYKYYTSDTLLYTSKRLPDGTTEWTEVRNKLGLDGALRNYQKDLLEWTGKISNPSVKAQKALDELGIDNRKVICTLEFPFWRAEGMVE